MKHRLLKLGAFLLLGAIVNVGVVCACGWWIDIERVASVVGGVGFANGSGNGSSGWYVEMKATPGAARIYRFPHGVSKRSWASKDYLKRRDKLVAYDMSNHLPRWTLARQPIAFANQSGPHYWCEDARGWPLVCFKCQIDISSLTLKRLPRGPGESIENDRLIYRDIAGRINASKVLAPDDCVQDGLLLEWQGPKIKPFPLRPLWTPLIANSVAYAAVLWLLFAAPIALRRRRRIKRGLCPACAYPVGSSDVCTECGAQLPLPLGVGRGEGKVCDG